MSLSVGAAGSNALRARMDKLKKKASKEQLRKALEAGGKVLQQALQERTPERADSPSGTALPPGAMKADIHITSGEDEHGDPTVSVGFGPSTAQAAVEVEYGHVEVRQGKTVGHVPAHPFIRSTWEATQADAAQAVIDTLKKEE